MIAVLFAALATALCCIVNAKADGNLIERAVSFMDLPARILMAFSGPEHYGKPGTNKAICVLSIPQWLIIGTIVGFMIALLRRRKRRT